MAPFLKDTLALITPSDDTSPPSSSDSTLAAFFIVGDLLVSLSYLFTDFGCDLVGRAFLGGIKLIISINS